MQKLYALPLSQFTAARNARAKALKQDDPELAAAVGKLPKPSVAAAALNELVHEDPSEVRALIQSGKRLRQAQEAAVRGRKADLDGAVREHREALERVQRDLRRRKLSGPTLERATQTLRVASVDADLAPLLERGVLHEEVAASGFGLDPGIVTARPGKRAAAPPPPPPKTDRKELERKRRAAREALRAAERARDAAENRAEAALRELERAKAAVERARQALDDAG
jgi:hypothetical protein